MRTAICFISLIFLSTPGYSETYYIPDDYGTIQEAIDSAGDSDILIVRSGTYFENINLMNKALTLTSEQGAAATWIDGSQAGSVVTCDSGEGPNTILDGFTLYNGSEIYGGGMFNSGSSPTVVRCTFQENTAGSWGGGMMNYYSSSMVAECTFQGNAAYEGGGMYNRNCPDTLTVTDCSFQGNSAGEGGGGICNWECSPAVVQSLFMENSANSGAGMINYSSSPTVTQSIFLDNTAVFNGGGIYNWKSPSVVTNCILWNNIPEEIYDYLIPPVITYCCIQGGYAGAGNIDSDPLFIDPANHDLRLDPGSPCIDAGDNNAPGIPDKDFEGDPRVFPGNGKGYRIGVFHQPAIVDMGIDEFCTFKHKKIG